MMSVIEEVKRDLKTIKGHWYEQDPKIRFLDIMALIQILIFGLSFVFMSAFEFSKIVSNTAMMAYPVMISGFLFVYRSRISKNIEEAKSARKEFIMFAVIITSLIALTFLYSFVFLLV